MSIQLPARVIELEQHAVRIREELSSEDLTTGQRQELEATLEGIKEIHDYVEAHRGEVANKALKQLVNAGIRLADDVLDVLAGDVSVTLDKGPSVTDGAALQRLMESAPAAFQESWGELGSEDRQMAMFTLQQHTAMQAQLSTMMTNMQQAQHNASMAIARNLSA